MTAEGVRLERFSGVLPLCRISPEGFSSSKRAWLVTELKTDSDWLDIEEPQLTESIENSVAAMNDFMVLGIKNPFVSGFNCLPKPKMGLKTKHNNLKDLHTNSVMQSGAY